MATFDFKISGTIYDAPDVQQARDKLRKRLLNGKEPFQNDVLFDEPEGVVFEEVDIP